MAFKLLSKLDFLTPKPSLLIGGQSRMKSCLGGLFSLCLVILGIITLFFFSKDMVLRRNPKIIQNNLFTNDSSITLSNENFLLMIAVVDAKGRIGNYDGYVNVTADRVDISSVSKGEKKITYTPIKVELCTEEHIGAQFKEQTAEFDLSSYFCLEAEYSAFVSNPFANSTSSYSYIRTFTAFCNPETESNCKSQTEIDERFSDYFMLYKVRDTFANHRNYTSPIQSILKNYIFRSSSAKYTYNYIYLTEMDYHTDSGYVFEDVSTIEAVSIDSTESSSQNKKESQKRVPLSFEQCIFAFNREGKGFEMFREYKKVQNVLADVGGFLKGIAIIFALVMNQYSSVKFSYLLYKERIDAKLVLRVRCSTDCDSKDLKNAELEKEKIESVSVKQSSFFYRKVYSLIYGKSNKFRKVDRIIEEERNLLDIYTLFDSIREFNLMKHVLLEKDLVKPFESLSKVLVLNSSQKENTDSPFKDGEPIDSRLVNGAHHLGITS